MNRAQHRQQAESLLQKTGEFPPSDVEWAQVCATAAVAHALLATDPEGRR